MNKLLEKLDRSRSGFPRRKIGGEGSSDLPELSWSCTMEDRKREGASLSRWLLVVLPLAFFVSLGVYFAVADFRLLTSVVERDATADRNFSATRWPQESDAFPPGPREEATTPPQSLGEAAEDPNLVVRLDYVDVSSEEGRFVQDVLGPGRGSGETVVVLRNDDGGKKIFLKSSGAAIPRDPDPTTAKAFVYSPTVPQTSPRRPKAEATTEGRNDTEDSSCFSTRLPFCEGVLPYDVVRLPELPGLERHADLEPVLPLLERILDSGCSPRAREFVCSVLEPECRPEGAAPSAPSAPCRSDCEIVSGECKDFIPEAPPLARIFDCRKYPAGEGPRECFRVSGPAPPARPVPADLPATCPPEEFRCPDGTCIPPERLCDGVRDCPGPEPGVDESGCPACPEGEFRCLGDGACVPLRRKCDGRPDCADRSDEVYC